MNVVRLVSERQSVLLAKPMDYKTQTTTVSLLRTRDRFVGGNRGWDQRVDQWLSYGSELPIILVHVADSQIAGVADRLHHQATAAGNC